MNEDIRAAIVQTVRRTAFAGSSREIPLDSPLGEDGLGLDSMAIVELFTEIEERFGVELFESDWFDRGEFTVRSLIACLEGGTAPASRGAARSDRGPGLWSRMMRGFRRG